MPRCLHDTVKSEVLNFQAAPGKILTSLSVTRFWPDTNAAKLQISMRSRNIRLYNHSTYNFSLHIVKSQKNLIYFFTVRGKRRILNMYWCYCSAFIQTCIINATNDHDEQAWQNTAGVPSQTHCFRQERFTSILAEFQNQQTICLSACP